MKKFSILTVGVDVVNIDQAIEKAKELQGILKNCDSLSGRIVRDLIKSEGKAVGNEYTVDLKKLTKCEYCEEAKETSVYGNETYKYVGGLQDSSNYGMWIYKINGKWILRSHGRNELNEVFISHCPKCGRELT